eukprot:4432711-Prymnesium_polylepis.1
MTTELPSTRVARCTCRIWGRTCMQCSSVHAHKCDSVHRMAQNGTGRISTATPQHKVMPDASAGGSGGGGASADAR